MAEILDLTGQLLLLLFLLLSQAITIPSQTLSFSFSLAGDGNNLTHLNIPYSGHLTPFEKHAFLAMIDF